jgi:sigma-B regulation protein RsbU (phosphoserine phosphatase)
VNRAVVIVNLLLMASAFALQAVGTRRVRREIADTWRDPLQNAREQVRMRDELQYARQLQLSMLPEAPPRVGWLDLAAISIPAAEVGGDYYDFFVEGDRVAIVACDVAGHGMQSGLVLAAIRGGLITSLRRSMATPSAILTQLHDLVAQTSRRRMLTTAVVVLLDRASGRMTVASAAHPPVVLRHGSAARLIDAFAPPLGVRLPFAPAEQTVEVAPGDVVVIHSDGVYESRNAGGEEYGLVRLQQFVAAQPPDASASQIRDAIVRDIEQFRGRAQDDDATIVVARLL